MRVVETFESVLDRHGHWPLCRGPVRTLQVNVGKICNQACHHCHVEAGPSRTESMEAATVARVLELLAASPAVEVLDVTGGAPELNPHFWSLIEGARRLGRRVIDRCNLTVLLEPDQQETAARLAGQGVEIVASLPCYVEANVDRQRGRGVFDKSIEVLHQLNRLGYGCEDSSLILDLVYNPGGASLPPAQQQLEMSYKAELWSRFGVRFRRLLTVTNMPIMRFAEQLARDGRYEAYQALLVNHFNPATLPELMCRSLLSVGYDGRLYDCDFNQMLEIDLAAGPETVWSLDSVDELEGQAVATERHCFGCTAGAGSSCTGALL